MQGTGFEPAQALSHRISSPISQRDLSPVRLTRLRGLLLTAPAPLHSLRLHFGVFIKFWFSFYKEV